MIIKTPALHMAGHIAHECLLDYLRTPLGLPEGLPGLVMAIRAGWSP